ncbi:extracellular superoxide dismutase [Cu-Zn]-like [Melanotaenia boesemani]|uniref:extracellular superoxide dismutase [Cu-Zn]-like n=1 Tax=Melanotaenia boesemani TaxID=1250792 RepID=UPI001C058AC9|nr:extracellular superoxide dismutase [Cu-Zn]-like [Melanotaenia boesemani]
MFTMQLYGSASILETALLVFLATFQQCASAQTETLSPPEVSQHNGTLYAACKVRPSTSLPDGLPKLYGQVLFKQDHPQGKLQVLLGLSGFPDDGPPQARAVHIHQYGDLSRGCDSTGGHYNPYGVNHPNHPGDFGNFEPYQGKISSLIESDARLFGGLSVFGRAVVVHEMIDDLGRGGDAGSLLHGNAGRRLACCIIGISSPSLWNTQHKRYTRLLRRN